MDRKTKVGLILLVVVLFGVFLFSTFLDNPINTASVISNPEGESQLAGNQENVIEMTSSGFNPKELKISQGETVTWINMDSKEHWPASAMHPTHTVYPGSDIKKCHSDESGMIFDACGGIPVGESYSFTFNEVGSWSYHDHIVNGMFGKIIVE